MEKIVSIEELQNNTKAYVGKSLTIEAFMSSNFEEAFLTASENFSDFRISLDESITEKLMKYIPCWGGGRYVYYDNVEITGILITKREKLFLTNISCVKAKRKNQVYVAVLD